MHERNGQGETNDWLTPRYVIDALGPFDLDPCATMNPPWPTAATMWNFTNDGTSRQWFGRVWLNPPYGPHAARWCSRLADHGDGIALIFARTETRWFQAIAERSTAILFPAGRIRFCWPDGRVAANATAPNAFIAYGESNADRLRNCGFNGFMVRPQFQRDQTATLFEVSK